MGNRREETQFLTQMSKHTWLFHEPYAQRTETNPARIKKHFHLIVLIRMSILHAHAELRNTIWKVKHQTHYAQLACARAAFLIHFKNGQLKHHILKVHIVAPFIAFIGQQKHCLCAWAVPEGCKDSCEHLFLL